KKGAPKNFFPRGKIFPPGEKFLGVFKNPQKGAPNGLPLGLGVFKNPRGFFPLLGKKGGPQKFFPRGKNFSPGKNFWGFLKTPKKGAPFFKNPRGFLKTPGGFSPFWGKKGAPKNFFPRGKIFPPGEKFLGVFKNPQKGAP
ncbi:hypothetical protein ED860_19940, partial [Acinetobacter baumannii]